ncbi:NaeI family type II restriction endonuclease [Dietzia sp. PP-33]|uniref:NaeI family type II restriction endonuclease n=1 Tax=Dietzia sp. PP-33 TaxID=2957500 RepID=UPI0029A44299|nr:NaeI family type II restriction endonuclease [Dietzia sp. PP-33]MDX2359010.1 hypothetical protein [Dietzia sp. PP-33]
MATNAVPGPGHTCQPDGRTARKGQAAIPQPPPHTILAPADDLELQQVLQWLQARPDLEVELRDAILDAINYVIEGSITGRFYLYDPEVDSDERSSVGTKLQYRLLRALGLPKQKPLDTVIAGIPVEVKTTIRDSWMIPTESQCEICLLIKIDAAADHFYASIMRAHRVWLRDGANKDGKRSFTADAVKRFLAPVVDGQLPRNPLRDLTEDQLAVVFGRGGIRKRLTSFFGYMPHTVVPRYVIETIGLGAKDPMRRARQAKPDVLAEHNLVLLCGTWQVDCAAGAAIGYALEETDWVAVDPAKIPSALLEKVLEGIRGLPAPASVKAELPDSPEQAQAQAQP